MSATMERQTDRAAWLDRRRRGIGASDFPAVLGRSPYKTRLDLYLEKIGEGHDGGETEAMEIGTAAEPMLAALYEKRTGRTIAHSQLSVESAVHPYILATLDGVTTDGRLVEMKTTAGRKEAELGDEGTDELPSDWIIQGHAQLLAADAEVVDFAVLSGGRGFRFRTYTLHRSPEWDGILVNHGAEFWDRVVSRNPPPPSLPADAHNLARFFKPSGRGIVLPADACDWAERWETVKAEIKAMEAEKSDIESRLRLAMEDASIGELRDGRFLKRQVREVAETTIIRKSFTTDYLQLVKGR